MFNKIRLFLIELLIGRDLKVISNITVTSDIIQYNNGVDLMIGGSIKYVSDRQSFVYNPSDTIYVR